MIANILRVKKMPTLTARAWASLRCEIAGGCPQTPTHMVYSWFQADNRNGNYRRTTFLLACDEHAAEVAAAHDLVIEGRP